MRPIRRIKVERRIPTASMADLAFLLLIFFMATSIIRAEEGLPVKLPRARMGEIVPTEKVTHVFIDQDNVVMMNDVVVGLDEIEPLLRQRLEVNPSLVVSVNADARCDYETVARLLGRMRAADARQVSFAADPEKE